jgi:DNA-binding NarL/FixJ family response regulator
LTECRWCGARVVTMIKLIIVAATRFYREGLALVLRNVNGFAVVSTLARPEELEPEPSGSERVVVLLDIADLQDGPSVVISLRARNPGLRIIALGVSELECDIVAYAELGVAGYLTRNHSISELVRTVESVAIGEMRCSPRVAAALSRRVAQLSAELQPGPNAGVLSRREAEVAVLLEQGLSNQEIARQLCIALATVKNHVHNILDKLGLPGRAAAAAWARQQRLDHSALMRSTAYQALSPNNRPHS